MTGCGQIYLASGSQTSAPNVDTNTLPNHGSGNVSLIETYDDWCGTKVVTPIVHDKLEKVVASLSVKKKKEFVILTPANVVTLVPSKTLIKPKFVIETAAQGMTRSGRCYTLEEIALGVQKGDQDKKPIIEGDAEEFWRRMQPIDYFIVKQALMKDLDDTYVPVGISSDNVATMIHQVIRGHRISFCDDELPFEGRSHNKALHITIVCRKKVVNWVLVDDGSGLNISPLSTLSYNLLLGRPFIHMDGVVPFTLHQMMKLVWKNEELVIHGKGSHSDRQVPIMDEVSRGTYFYTVELVNAIGEDLAPQPLMSTVYRMIANVINVNFKPANVMSCHELNEQNEAEKTETVNLGDPECAKEFKIIVHLNEDQRKGLIHLLTEYIDVFIWEVSDMLGLSTNVVSHKLPINLRFDLVKQKAQKFKPELSLKIKQEITKHIESRLVEVTEYPTWLANVVPSFVDCYTGYHQILMDEEDAEKIAFSRPWGVYHYRVIPVSLKNAGVTYIRAMTTIFHDMIHKEIKVYVDDVIIKSRESLDHLTHLKKFFDHPRRYNLMLNPSKCAFGVPTGKLLGFIVSKEKNPVDEDYKPLKTYFHDEEISSLGEDISKAYPEPDCLPWYFDIKKYLESGIYPEDATSNQKKSIRRMTLNFFLSGEILYRRTTNLGLLRCVDAAKLIEQIHAGVCGTHMNGLTLAINILQSGYFWMNMENDCCKFVQKCHKCQVHGDLIRVPPHELNVMSSPWPFVAWGMDVIGSIEPTASNGHKFILVAINYFTKWVEAVSYKSVTKKVVADFFRNNLICRFGVPESIITNNGANLNSHLMRDICEQFNITHRNSIAYRPQMNGAVEAANKNIMKILRKIIDNHCGWHVFPYSLLGYHTIFRTSIGATPYLLVYGTEAVIPAEIENRL
ncbi:uncharacterized protein [Solanum lycopersicum]|uniref:uncharacterized protein n=1 Tax=Solanum lycopersicum TaxID=4081 RepID=UPI0037487E26